MKSIGFVISTILERKKNISDYENTVWVCTFDLPLENNLFTNWTWVWRVLDYLFTLKVRLRILKSVQKTKYRYFKELWKLELQLAGFDYFINFRNLISSWTEWGNVTRKNEVKSQRKSSMKKSWDTIPLVKSKFIQINYVPF